LISLAKIKSPIAPALLILLAVVLIAGSGCRQRSLDMRVTLDPSDKIPYGAYIAYENMAGFFPESSVEINRLSPLQWWNIDEDADSRTNNLFMVLSPQFIPEEAEMKELLSYAESGNEIFISTRFLSPVAQRYLRCSTNFFDNEFSMFPTFDSLQLNLVPPVYEPGQTYQYPGKRYQMYFSSFDSSTTHVLGTGANAKPDFICMKIGEGAVYVHLAPLAFSNYFLLHKNNLSYFSRIFSLINPKTERVFWDKYYLYKKRQNQSDDESEPNLFAVLLGYRSFRWGLLTLLALVIIFVLLEMRRKQWIIPPIARHRNESLDFVKTIGRLYFQRGDHTNLAAKMASYFLEHVRSRYKLPTSSLDEEFAIALQQKSGYPQEKIERILSFINGLDNGTKIKEEQLSYFHQLLESFYKHA